jgi:hypothetical protein
MAIKRWRKPCQFCKGKYTEFRCMICGWRAGKIPISQLPLGEQAKIRGIRNRKQFLHELDGGITRCANHSTEVIAVDQIVETHREDVLLMLEEYENGVSLKSLAEKRNLTVSLVSKLLQLTRDKINRGIMQVEVKPRTECHPQS